MNKKLKSTFMYFTHSVKCCICKKSINEGYALDPQTNNAWYLMEKKFGDIANWNVGECCFGGYYGANKELDADDWFEIFIEGEKRVIKYLEIDKYGKSTKSR